MRGTLPRRPSPGQAHAPRLYPSRLGGTALAGNDFSQKQSPSQASWGLTERLWAMMTSASVAWFAIFTGAALITLCDFFACFTRGGGIKQQSFGIKG